MHARHSRRAVLLVVALAMLATPLVPARALAGEAGTGRRVLGTLLGSIDGALAVRAATFYAEPSPALNFVYIGAVGGGAILGYGLAGNDDALTALSIALIPLTIVNLILPSPWFSETRPIPAPLSSASPLHEPGGDPDHLRITALHLRY